MGVQIIALGVTYFVAVSAVDVTTNVGTIDDLTSTARIVLVLPVAALDAVFILWVFTSLSRTLNQLQARKAGAKLDLYRHAVTSSGCNFTLLMPLDPWWASACLSYMCHDALLAHAR